MTGFTRFTGFAGFTGFALALLVAAPVAAQDRTVELLRTLADAPGPPGFEEPVRKIMVDQMKPYAGSITFDGLGSIIATQGTSGPRIMVDAHMDELGGIVRRITPKGLLTMQMLGGWLDQALVDQRWTIVGSKGPVRAVTGIRDVHVVPPDERGRVFPRDSLFLDVGASNEAEVRAMGIEPGDPVVPDAPFTVLNGTANYLGKGWDDRVGCGVVVEAMRRLATLPHPNQIVWAITTQEEVGLRGAHTAAERIKPELGIALEGGITGDVFPGRPEETQVRLGAGPGTLPVRFLGARQPQADGVHERGGGGESPAAADRSRAGLRRRLGRDPEEQRRRADGQPGRARALHARAQRRDEPPRLRSDGRSAGRDAAEAGRGGRRADPRLHAVG